MIAAMEEPIKKGSRPEEQMQHRNYEGAWQPKPRHEFIDTGAELIRLYSIDISSTSNHAASRPDETLNAREAENEYPRTYGHSTQSASIRTEVNKIGSSSFLVNAS
jgi:hypothetical protein